MMSIVQDKKSVNSQSVGVREAVPSVGVNGDTSRGFFNDHTVAVGAFHSFLAGGDVVASVGADRLLRDALTEAKSEKSCSVPYGLAALLNNCLLKDKRIEFLQKGFVAAESVIEDYRRMKEKVDGKKGSLMVNDAGEVMAFPVRSRWNSDWCYGGYVGRRMLEHLRGLKKVTHFILTVKPEKVLALHPDWWCYGDREFLVVAIGFMVSEFLRKLRQRKKGRGEPWNFITWVLEFHESGYVHVHFMFYGHWVADIDEIWALWGVFDRNGVRFAKRRFTDGEGICRYLTHYLSKDLQALGDKKESESLAAFMWYFRRRLYNFRHARIGLDGKRSLGIAGEQFKRPLKWHIYEGLAGQVITDADGCEIVVPPRGVRIGKRIDDYLASLNMAVCSGVQVAEPGGRPGC